MRFFISRERRLCTAKCIRVLKNRDSESQKQTRCFDFHKIFQDTTTDYCAECSSALRNKLLREESKANEKMF
ncbi:unnamed protein product [Bathycoccus prasinos]